MTVPLTAPDDGCDACLTPDATQTVKAYLVQPDGDAGVRAYYRCPRGHRWHTSWLVGTDGLAVRHDAA